VLAVGFGLSAVAGPSAAFASQGNIGTIAPAPLQVAQGMPPADFGSPPSGQYPILFNDHHVYAKPDVDKQNRVLAALVRGNTILVPLRSMFEQMGATVSYDPASKTVDVSKPGSDVKVTVGKPEVVINGESRPLDVPPIIYQGIILVPVRVISEGMGAYVQWVPQKKTVVVRYVPAPPPTPPPTPAPTRPPTARPATPPPTPAPTPTPAPAKTTYYEKFIVGDYMISPKVYNEWSPGNSGQSSYGGRAGIEFPLFGMPWMLEGDWRHWSYPHNGNQPPVPGTTATFICPNPPGTIGCVTTLGGVGFPQAYVGSFTPREDDVDGRFAIKLADPRLYLGVGYAWQTNNYGYPSLRGFGFGAEKLPDLDQTISIYGSVWYYPSIQGNYGSFQYGPCNPGTGPRETGGCPFLASGGTLSYRMFKYQIGGTWNFGGSSFPLFLDLGFLGNYYTGKQNAPSNINKYAGYVGLGLHF
jgi:copper amine oxidase-like protein